MGAAAVANPGQTQVKKTNGRLGKVDLDNEFKENEGQTNQRISAGLLPLVLNKHQSSRIGSIKNPMEGMLLDEFKKKPPFLLNDQSKQKLIRQRSKVEENKPKRSNLFAQCLTNSFNGQGSIHSFSRKSKEMSCNLQPDKKDQNSKANEITRKSFQDIQRRDIQYESSYDGKKQFESAEWASDRMSRLVQNMEIADSMNDSDEDENSSSIISSASQFQEKRNEKSDKQYQRITPKTNGQNNHFNKSKASNNSSSDNSDQEEEEEKQQRPKTQSKQFPPPSSIKDSSSSPSSLNYSSPETRKNKQLYGQTSIPRTIAFSELQEKSLKQFQESPNQMFQDYLPHNQEESNKSNKSEKHSYPRSNGSEKGSDYEVEQLDDPNILICDFLSPSSFIRKSDIEANDSFNDFPPFDSSQQDNEQGISTPIKTLQKEESKLEKTSSPARLENFSSNFSSNNNRSFESMNNNSSSWLGKQQKILYIRSQHSHIPERQGTEKNFKIEIVENGGEDGPFKSNCKNKSYLIQEGIGVHSRKGTSPEEKFNMSDYFIYLDQHCKVITLLVGHGAYGNLVSNLASRLLFKHFLKDPQIKANPEDNLKQLFINVDKYISQHIDFFNLGDHYNCALSGVSCSLVLQLGKDRLYVASLGNTQTVVFRQHSSLKSTKANFISLSGFHVPTSKIERDRILKNTGEIRKWKGEFIDRVFVRGRTFPAIEVTRCLGNQVAKQIGVISEPDVLSYKITNQIDLFLLVTSPNFFELISHEETFFILNSYNKKTVKKATEVLTQQIKNIQMNNQQQQQPSISQDIIFAIYYFA